MKNCADVEKVLRGEMQNLTDGELMKLALDMGVSGAELEDATRSEIEDKCVALEQYAFVH